MRWFRRKKENETRLDKAVAAGREAQSQLRAAEALVDKVVNKVTELKEQERINRLAPVIMEAVRRRHG
jgi:hypothetical protein